MLLQKLRNVFVSTLTTLLLLSFWIHLKFFVENCYSEKNHQPIICPFWTKAYFNDYCSLLLFFSYTTFSASSFFPFSHHNHILSSRKLQGQEWRQGGVAKEGRRGRKKRERKSLALEHIIILMQMTFSLSYFHSLTFILLLFPSLILLPALYISVVHVFHDDENQEERIQFYNCNFHKKLYEATPVDSEYAGTLPTSLLCVHHNSM